MRVWGKLYTWLVNMGTMALLYDGRSEFVSPVPRALEFFSGCGPIIRHVEEAITSFPFSRTLRPLRSPGRSATFNAFLCCKRWCWTRTTSRTSRAALPSQRLLRCGSIITGWVLGRDRVQHWSYRRCLSIVSYCCVFGTAEIIFDFYFFFFFIELRHCLGVVDCAMPCLIFFFFFSTSWKCNVSQFINIYIYIDFLRLLGKDLISPRFCLTAA